MAEQAGNSRPSRDVGLVWSATLLCGLAVAYNSGAVMASSPFMKIDLDLDANTLQWIMISYILVATGLVGVMGGFADIFGRLRLLIFGAVMFIAGSLICIIADNGAVVIVGRAIQGLGGAAIFGTGLAVLTVATPEALRTLALGMWAAATALGQGLGPLIGGGLTDAIDWRAIFAFDIVLLMGGLFACVLLARNHLVPEDPARHNGIDYLGAALMMLALALLTLAMTRGQQQGWGSTQIVLLLAFAAAAGVGFIARERHAERPLFQLRFFREPSYMAAATGTFVAGFGIFGLIYYFNVFFQAPDGPDYSAFRAGLALLPCTMLFFVGSIGFPRLLTGYDLHWPTTLGMVLLASGFWFLSNVTIATAYAEIWWRLALIGLGFGLTFGLLPRVGLRDLPDADAGQGSGVINVFLYVGFTFGIAACGVVVNAVRHDIVKKAVDALAFVPENRTQVIHDLAHGSNSVVDKVLNSLDPADATNIKSALSNALEAGFGGAMMLLALASVIGAVLCGVLLRQRAGNAETAA